MARQKTKILALITLGLLTSVSACAEAEQTDIANGKAPLPVAEQVAQAKQDLATRLNVDSSAITEEAVRVVHWRSGARGCPNPEMSYTMEIVPGVLILLRVRGKTFNYHAGPNGVPFYCPAKRVEAPTLGKGADVM